MPAAVPPPAGAPAVLLLFDIGPMEFFILVGAAIMLFGGDLPDVARKAGRTVRKLRALATEAARNLETPDVTRLPGGDELRRDLDVKAELGLREAVGVDWRAVASLPQPGEAASAAATPVTPPAAAAPPASAAQPPASAPSPSPREDAGAG
jgi:Sec-independent protein translocase protein TatA